jgi:hypothetical protein
MARPTICGEKKKPLWAQVRDNHCALPPAPLTPCRRRRSRCRHVEARTRHGRYACGCLYARVRASAVLRQISSPRLTKATPRVVAPANSGIGLALCKLLATGKQPVSEYPTPPVPPCYVYLGSRSAERGAAVFAPPIVIAHCPLTFPHSTKLGVRRHESESTAPPSFCPTSTQLSTHLPACSVTHCPCAHPTWRPA